jgi:chromosome segregation ATPase
LLPQVIGDTCELIKRLDRFKVREASRAKEKDELPSVKAELEDARERLSVIEKREASWAEKEKKFEADLAALAEQHDKVVAERDSARAAEKASKQQLLASEAEVKELKADRNAVEQEAVSRFRNSEEFFKLQVDYAVDWVVDCVAQCRRLCREKLGAGPYRFLRDEDIVKAVQAKRSSPSAEDEDEEDDDDISEEDTAEPSQPIPSFATAADLPPSDQQADAAT